MHIEGNKFGVENYYSCLIDIQNLEREARIGPLPTQTPYPFGILFFKIKFPCLFARMK